MLYCILGIYEILYLPMNKNVQKSAYSADKTNGIVTSNICSSEHSWQALTSHVSAGSCSDQCLKSDDIVDISLQNLGVSPKYTKRYNAEVHIHHTFSGLIWTLTYSRNFISYMFQSWSRECIHI
jgi:hypothetical protein